MHPTKTRNRLGNFPTISSLVHSLFISQLLNIFKHKKSLYHQNSYIKHLPKRNTLIVFNSVMSNFAFFKTALRIYWIANFT